MRHKFVTDCQTGERFCIKCGTLLSKIENNYCHFCHKPNTGIQVDKNL